MQNNEIKSELIKRYRYIYENAVCILAPFVYEQIMRTGNGKLNDLPVDINLDIESFLLSDINYDESVFYRYMENNKKNAKFMNSVRIGNKLTENRNSKQPYLLRDELNIWKVLSILRNYISRQSGDLKNKNKKLIALDEYFRIARYKNNNDILTSGFKVNFKDLKDHRELIIDPNGIILTDKPFRNVDDVGLGTTDFIEYVVDEYNHYDYNNSLFTEEEKQKLYLYYHDELPWDLEISCTKEPNFNLINRPEYTKECGKKFFVDENQMFMDDNGNYYQMCPKCGFIVNVPSGILSEGIKRRIKNRCLGDSQLFKKMCLYSELYALEKNNDNDNTRLVKKLNNKR